MLSCLDEGVANLTRALTARGMINDTLIFFATDNGGPISDDNCPQGKCNAGQGSRNWPRRGGKHALWDGGVRGPAFVHYPPEIKAGRWGGLVHAVDLFPSLLEALGVTDSPRPGFELDGISMWQAWRSSGTSPRSDLLVNIDTFRDGWMRPIPSSAALVRVAGPRQWKLLVGYPGPPDIWKAPPELGVSSLGEGQAYVFCRPYCLYDVAADPMEKQDLAGRGDEEAQVAQLMLEALAKYNSTLMTALYPGGKKLKCLVQDGVLTPCSAAWSSDPQLVI